MKPETGTMGDDLTGDTSWQNLVLSAPLGVIALKATVNVISVVEQEWILA